MTIKKLLKLNNAIYGPIDGQLATIDDFFYYQEKYFLRFYASVKNNKSQLPVNLCVALFWCIGFVIRFSIDLESEIKKRYPHKCPYCLDSPCTCIFEKRNKIGKKTGRPVSGFPKDINGLQDMIRKIYPVKKIDKIAIIDELHSLSFLCREFARKPSVSRLSKIKPATADLFILYLILANTNNINLTDEIEKTFYHGCYLCHKTPCQCYYTE